MVAKYDRHGVRFMYPENWSIQEDEPDSDVHCITLQSPGSGFWLLQILESPEMVEGLATETLSSMKQDYEDVEVDDAEEEILGISMTGYDLQFYCLDFLVSAHLRTFPLGDRACVLLSQAEDNEYDKIAPVFKAITASLIQEAECEHTG